MLEFFGERFAFVVDVREAEGEVLLCAFVHVGDVFDDAPVVEVGVRVEHKGRGELI